MYTKSFCPLSCEKSIALFWLNLMYSCVEYLLTTLFQKYNNYWRIYFYIIFYQSKKWTTYLWSEKCFVNIIFSKHKLNNLIRSKIDGQIDWLIEKTLESEEGAQIGGSKRRMMHNFHRIISSFTLKPIYPIWWSI